MQIHHTKAKQTVFSFNNWNAGTDADIGIGNSAGRTDDWTFASSAGTLASARLRVLVRKVKP
jgi:sialate O-acetylesterase